jgi:translation initiation factor 3 subunit D
VIKTLVDFMLSQPEGKYCLVKDPNKFFLRIYSVPANVFENMTEEDTKTAATAGIN